MTGTDGKPLASAIQWAMVAACVLGLALPFAASAAAADRPDTASPMPLSTGDAVAPAVTFPASPPQLPSEQGLRLAPKRLKDYGLPGLDKRVNLNTKTTEPWDIVQLIEFLAHQGGINKIIIGKGVTGMTTKLLFDDVSVEDALETVLSVNNLAYEVKNGILTIMTDAEYVAIYGGSFYDNKQVQVVDLNYADAARVAAMLQQLKSPTGNVIPDPVTGTLILIDTPAKIREMKAVIEKADISTVSRVMQTESMTFVLKHAEVTDIQGQISSILSKEAGSMRVDTRSKTLIVTDLPHTMRKVESMVAAFDLPKRQVFIEAKIISVLLEDNYKLGINWEHLFEGIGPRVSIRSAVNRTAAVAPASGVGSLTYKTIVAGGDLSVILDALKTIGETKILSNPHVAVMSDQEATIKVITDEPYAEASLEAGTTNVVGENIKFIEVGVKLTVTPRVSDDGMISMAISPEVSDVVRTYQAFRAIPVVRKSKADTSVMIHDGETVIIGGMIQNKKIEGSASVPFLGRIPLLGVLFRSRTESYNTEETVVFLTPRIITGEKPVLLNRDQEKVLKPARSTGKLKRVEASADVPASEAR